MSVSVTKLVVVCSQVWTKNIQSKLSYQIVNQANDLTLKRAYFSYWDSVIGQETGSLNTDKCNIIETGTRQSVNATV